MPAGGWAKLMVASGLPMQVKALHGRMKQSVRESTLEAYIKLPVGACMHCLTELFPLRSPAAVTDGL